MHAGCRRTLGEAQIKTRSRLEPTGTVVRYDHNTIAAHRGRDRRRRIESAQPGIRPQNLEVVSPRASGVQPTAEGTRLPVPRYAAAGWTRLPDSLASRRFLPDESTRLDLVQFDCDARDLGDGGNDCQCEHAGAIHGQTADPEGIVTGRGNGSRGRCRSGRAGWRGRYVRDYSDRAGFLGLHECTRDPNRPPVDIDPPPGCGRVTAGHRVGAADGATDNVIFGTRPGAQVHSRLTD